MDAKKNGKVVPFPAPEADAKATKSGGGQHGKSAEVIPVFFGRQTELEYLETAPFLPVFEPDEEGDGLKLTLRFHPDIAEKISRVQIRADKTVPHPSEINGADTY